MARSKTVAADYERLTLRLPADVQARLREQAAVMGRTINAQAIYVLRYGLGLDPSPPYLAMWREDASGPVTPLAQPPSGPPAGRPPRARRVS